MTLRERDIRPRGSFDTLLSSAQQTASATLKWDRFVDSPCPACGIFAPEPVFGKNGYTYNTCLRCGSLYVSHRPCREDLAGFYAQLGAFAEFYAASGETRLEAIVRPRARMIVDLAAKNNINGTYCDIGCGNGALLGEIDRTGCFEHLSGIDPSLNTANEASLPQGVSFSRSSVGDGPIYKSADFATAFEVLEHVFWPPAFLAAVRRLLSPGGLFVFTTLTVDGWDIGELWREHESVCPPLHLNLMSISGIGKLVADCGFELLSLSTPGRLDVDIVRNMAKEKPGLQISRFARQIVEGPDELASNFQSFLRENGMSSHVQVIARRPTDG